MNRHILTEEERRKGGWTRAEQLAKARATHPTRAESFVRKIIQNQGVKYKAEYKITHEDGQPQWFDIAILDEYNQPVAVIEVDGSRDWHNRFYPGSKMAMLDDRKEQWCKERGISILWLNYITMSQVTIEGKIYKFLKECNYETKA